MCQDYDMQNVPSNLVPIFLTARGPPLLFSADLSSERTKCHELACLDVKTRAILRQ